VSAAARIDRRRASAVERRAGRFDDDWTTDLTDDWSAEGDDFAVADARPRRRGARPPCRDNFFTFTMEWRIANSD
jgi:hypothetical protein